LIDLNNIYKSLIAFTVNHNFKTSLKAKSLDHINYSDSSNFQKDYNKTLRILRKKGDIPKNTIIKRIRSFWN